MILTVGTRGSVLALAQTNRVLKQIKQAHPEVEFKLKIIKTVGDKEQGKPLFTIDCKGIFEKEIDQQVVNGEIDFAVHSLKDVPIVEQQTGTVLAAIPKRDSQNDVFISKGKVPLNDFASRLSCWNRQPEKNGGNQVHSPRLRRAANQRQRGHQNQQG